MKSFLVTCLVLYSSLAGAQDGEGLPPPNQLFRLLHHLKVTFQRTLLGGLNDTSLSLFIDVLVISAAVFFFIRSVMEVTNNKITWFGFLWSRMLPVLALFSLLDPVLYFQINTVIQDTASDLATVIQKIFTGFDDFSKVPGSLMLLFSRLEISTSSIGLLDMSFAILMLVAVGFMMYKNIFMMTITLSFYILFTFAGFQILFVFGLILLPFSLIKELQFMTVGWLKAMAFMFVFSVMWKLVLAMCVFIVYAAFFGATFFFELQQGASFAEFVENHTAGGQMIPFHVTSLYDVFVPLILFGASLMLISKAFALTQFVLTGYLSAGAPHKMGA